jgi:hypothetical protein
MRRMTMLTAALLVCVGFIGSESAQADRSTKGNKITLRLATDVPTRGMEKITVGGQTLYVSGKAGISGREVISTESIESRDGSDVELSLTKSGAARLADLLGADGTKQAVLFSGRKAIMAGSLSLSNDQGVATITGLNADDAEQLTQMIGGRHVIGSGPTLTVVANTTSIAPDSAVTLDIFITGVASLRTYQTKIDISGGDTGNLTVDDVFIDHARPNYVFGSAPKLDAVDRSGNRIGAVLMDGGVDATSAKYVGSYTVRASSDASGTFSVNVITADRSSIVMTSDNKELAVGAGPSALLTVGRANSLPASTK